MNKAMPAGRQGFTLVEVLVTIVIFSIVVSVVFSAIFMFYRNQSFTWDQSVAIEEARRGIKTMVREIREAKVGDDGSYSIESANDKEFVFYSDIDKDGATEKVRYFIGAGGVAGNQLIEECVVFSSGDSCSIVFSDFLSGDLISAEVKVSVEGDFGWNNREYADVFVDGTEIDSICRNGCTDCPGVWQGDITEDVTTEAGDNYLEVLVDSTWRVDGICDWVEPNHSMKVRVELNWEEEVLGENHELKKGVTNPTSDPISYPENQEEVSIISSYVRNGPAIFEYYDANGDLIVESPARLSDTKVMKVYLVINVNEGQSPDDVELESYVHLRNLKDE